MSARQDPWSSGIEHIVASRPRVAVIGAGISGLGAALRASTYADVELFELEPRLGGHAQTRLAANDVPVDVGFIVYNEPTYPLLTQLLADLGVATRRAPMSFSVRCDECGLELAGGTRRQLLESVLRHRRVFPLMQGIVALRRAAVQTLEAGALDDSTSLRAWAAEHRIPEHTLGHYLVPLTAAVWSTPPGAALDMPAATTLQFLDNHGLLRGRPPRWRTVVGGSATYVQALRRALEARGASVHLALGVRSVQRLDAGVRLVDRDGRHHDFDRVILATHPDISLALLDDPTPLEQELLGAWRYTDNDVVLHHDAAVLPTRRRMWAAWNYRISSCAADSGPARLSYQMDILQSLRAQVPWTVTVNPAPGEVRPELETYRTSSAHPVYDAAARASQRRMEELDLAAQASTSTWFCGAWRGSGFHEDGLRSGYAAADSMLAVRTGQVALT